MHRFNFFGGEYNWRIRSKDHICFSLRLDANIKQKNAYSEKNANIVKLKMLILWNWPHHWQPIQYESKISSIKHSLSITMHLAPSMNIYMNVVTTYKSQVCRWYIYICNIYDNIQTTKKKRKLENGGENPVSLHEKIFLITTKIFLPENYLPREWSWVSPSRPTCYRAWHSKTFLPFSHFGHEQKNAKIASESSLHVTLSMFLLWW